MTEKKSTAAWPYLAAIGANVFWGFSFMLTRRAMTATGCSPVNLLSIRFLITLVILTVIALVRRIPLTLRGRNWKTLLFVALFEPLYFFLETYGIRYTNSTVAGVVLSVSPVFALILAAFFLKEYPTLRQAVFCVLPIAGVVLVTIAGRDEGVVQPIGLALLAGCCIANAAYRTVNRSASREYSAFERTYALVFTGSILFTAYALIEARGDVAAWIRPVTDPNFLLPVLGLAVFCSVVAYLMINYATGKMSVLTLSIFGTITTVCSAVAGVLFLDEPISLLSVSGTVLILVGVWVVSRSAGVSDLRPRAFFRWFAAISKIPHPSGGEQKLADFLRDFAEKRHLPCETDGAGNVFMSVPAAPGYEKEPPILLQAHMDMVTARDPGVAPDAPLSLRIAEDRLTAAGTTLGADNAVGMATMLAVADDRRMAHPPLELLFTVEEETGLRGIRKFDLSRIRARRMLNMDCGYSHTLCLCSAGKIAGSLKAQFPTAPVDRAVELTITGGFDGHFEVLVTKPYACAEAVLRQLLAELPCRLLTLEAPTGNPQAALRAVVSLADSAVLEARFKALKPQYEALSPGLAMTVQAAEGGDAVSEADTETILTALDILQTGAYGHDPKEPTQVVTSGALKTVVLAQGRLECTCMARSFYDAEMETVFAGWRNALAERGLTLTKEDRYSGWPERASSPFRAQFEDAHRRILGYDADYERVQGGIETGVIVGAIPEMDAVGYAPSAHGAHTTREYLEINEVAPFWDVLTDVLAQRTNKEDTP